MKTYNSSKPGSTGVALGKREPKIEAAGRHRGVSNGGVCAVATLVKRLGVAQAINGAVRLLKVRRGYAESDHVLNIALNPLSGGQTLDDIELRRRDPLFLKSIDAVSLPDPTTAGDFCRRFSPEDINALENCINEVRVHVWKSQPESFFKIARIDADGVFVPTGSECAEGVDYSGQKRDWGYHPLIVSLANTQEPLFIKNRTGARPSHEGASELFDRSIDVCKQAGFQQIILRGDTDFSQTRHLDRWNDIPNVGFVFGFDAMPKLVDIADSLEQESWRPLARNKRVVEEDDERSKGTRHKDEVILNREYRNLELESEHVAEFEYSPTACLNSYRLVAVRKTIRVTKGHELLFPETRYFFYISNLQGVDAREIVREANDRCNQENLNSHLKSGVHALRAPLKTLNSNWAYMVMTSLAWTFKAWFGLMMLPKSQTETTRSLGRRILTMEFRTFVNNLMLIPALIIETGRQIIVRLLAETPWTPHLLNAQVCFRE